MVAAARAAADEKYAADIAEHDAQIKAEIAALKAWAVKNEKAELVETRSISTPTGTFGFRTGMPRVKFTRGWDVQRVIEAVLGLFPKRGWIRTVEELDKDAMIADRDKHAADLESVGVKIDQGETFYVDINLEEATNRYAC
jgi:phage host-nuclease inhibitor protein Gam